METEKKHYKKRSKDEEKFLRYVLGIFLKDNELEELQVQNEYGSICLSKKSLNSNSHAIGFDTNN